VNRCDNLAKCAYNYEVFNDFLKSEGQSCRCRRCSRLQGAYAATNPNLTADDGESHVQASYFGTWLNWLGNIDSCSPWMMPHNDAELRQLLKLAIAKGYKVRPSGATHSNGALLTDPHALHVVIISLAKYTAPPEWNYHLDEGRKLVKVNGGWNWLELYRRIRGRNLFLPTQTAGYFFQVAGNIANCVHGMGYTKSFLHSYVRQMRVMFYNGTIRIISDEAELKFWRNSYGLLGLILGVEIELEHRPRFQMITRSKTFSNWNAEEWWTFIKRDAEADLPDNISQYGAPGSRSALGGQFFADLVATNPQITVYMNKANSFASHLDVVNGQPSDMDANYHNWASQETWSIHGMLRYEDSASVEGAPPLKRAFVSINDVHDFFSSLPVDRALTRSTLMSVPVLIQQARDAVNDGFWVTQAPNTYYASYFIPPSRAFEAMDYIRRKQTERWGRTDFAWNLPFEFRFITITDDAVLQPVPPGMYWIAEIMTLTDKQEDRFVRWQAFREIEDHIMNEFGGVPHSGKLFAFGPNEAGYVEPFRDSKLCRLLTVEQKAKFEAYQRSCDPDGVFALNTTLGMKLLAPC